MRETRELGRLAYGAMAVLAVVLFADLHGASTVTSQSSDLPAGTWSVSGQGEGAIKFNTRTGKSFILLEFEDGWYWSAINEFDPSEWPKEGKARVRPTLGNLFWDEIGLDTFEVAKQGGKIIGLKVLAAFEDPGIGLKPGDVVTKVDKVAVTSLDELDVAIMERALDALNRSVTLTVLRSEKETLIEYDPQRLIEGD